MVDIAEGIDYINGVPINQFCGNLVSDVCTNKISMAEFQRRKRMAFGTGYASDQKEAKKEDLIITKP